MLAKYPAAAACAGQAVTPAALLAVLSRVDNTCGYCGDEIRSYALEDWKAGDSLHWCVEDTARGAVLGNVIPVHWKCRVLFGGSGRMHSHLLPAGGGGGGAVWDDDEKGSGSGAPVAAKQAAMSVNEWELRSKAANFLRSAAFKEHRAGLAASMRAQHSVGADSGVVGGGAAVRASADGAREPPPLRETKAGKVKARAVAGTQSPPVTAIPYLQYVQRRMRVRAAQQAATKARAAAARRARRDAVRLRSTLSV
jgi:hypothetical protein